MKRILFIIAAFVLFTGALFSQKKVIVHKGPHKKVVVVKKPGRRYGNRVVYFTPVWGPKHRFIRRWVFFPRYNLYWDNWNKVYVYRSGVIWITNPAPPPVVVNVDLTQEKKYELKEKEDQLDDVYQSNTEHKEVYKTE